MSGSTDRRRVALWVVACATVAAAIAVTEADDDATQERPSNSPKVSVSSNTRPSAQPREPAGAAASLPIDQLRRPTYEMSASNAFATGTWALPPPPPPPPPQPVASSPPVPRAPPLPFGYLGKMLDGDGQQVVYLARGDKAYTVRLGDTIDGTYKVEAIEAGQMVITYLPLNEQQRLPIGVTP